MAVTFTLKCKLVFDADGTTDWSTEQGANPFTATAGKTLICFQNGFQSNPGEIALPTDNNGTFTEFTNGKNYTYPMTIKIAHQFNAAGGSHTITPPALAANDDGYIWIYEVDGLPTSLTQTSGANQQQTSSTKNWTINSANGTPANGDIALAFTHYENSAGVNPTDLTNPTGFTQLDVEQNATSNLPSQLCWKQLTSGGSFGVTWAETLDNGKTDDFSVLVTLTPLLYPTIDTQPADQRGAVGATVTFTVSATTSGGTLHYQWERKDPAGGSWASVGTDTNSYTSGAGVRSTDSGALFRCTVTDDNGSLVSNAAEWIVTDAPTSYAAGDGMVVGDSYVGEGMVGAPEATSGVVSADMSSAGAATPSFVSGSTNKVDQTTSAAASPSLTAAAVATTVQSTTAGATPSLAATPVLPSVFSSNGVAVPSYGGTAISLAALNSPGVATPSVVGAAFFASVLSDTAGATPSLSASAYNTSALSDTAGATPSMSANIVSASVLSDSAGASTSLVGDFITGGAGSTIVSADMNTTAGASESISASAVSCANKTTSAVATPSLGAAAVNTSAMSSAGVASETLTTVRVMPSTHSVAAAASASNTSAAVFASVESPSGLATLSLVSASLMASVLDSDGAGAFAVDWDDISRVYVPSADRTLTIGAQSRVIIVVAESRARAITGESRQLSPVPEQRTVTIGEQNRKLTITDEERSMEP